MTQTQYHQHTLAAPFTCFGRGLHTGVAVVMKVLPAPEHTGVTFVRRDCKSGENEVRAIWFNVRNNRLNTTIANRFGVTINTIEHIMAALFAHGVDNARVVLDGPEVPILEGSARTFSDLILASGVRAQRARRKVIVVRHPVAISDGDKRAALTPSPVLSADLTISFKAAAIGTQRLPNVRLDEATFTSSIRDARTFGMAEDIESMLQSGYGRGASLRNAIVVKGDSIVNPEGLFYPDEFVRHKILDLYGDLSLAGAPIVGHFRGYKSGHQMNTDLLSELLCESENFAFVDKEYAEHYWLEIHYKNIA
ncbi:UDP-3-O-acyl-N-acetylglucosamine deacetylase [Gilvimarinus algae]|uniref:UDP-3-O-acyl-N-acetylglucosamine deacetylase n=1 Tax=Gilvimarinus algae TaxID=3058037 RepID=A0ABT8TCW0_9GAMM|nr:UDP-3-O-acyl-N-acetylglucosamine deacetylase [Gilvimarinus sp. SDUM040014]MDO3381218.1 UDP-3-O-acyl-N-acetylglucosamine deacetylase [Gilvimarinus sp. SDUM040014]